MVFHENKLILIDPQYLENEGYLDNPPIQFKSSQLDQSLPVDVLQLFKHQSMPMQDIRSQPGGARVPLLPSNTDRDMYIDSTRIDKDTYIAAHDDT